MNQLVPQNFGALSSRFANQPKASNDLAAGVQGGFGLIGYRGKVWSVRYRGEERQLMRDDGDGPRNSIELAIIKASAVISKIFYAEGWVEGSTAAPDCFSTNGVTPDAGAAKKQSLTCAQCPKNAWGSRITPAGKQGKACQDSKRLAVVPLADVRNEVFGGPMLLRVPAASLQDMAHYGSAMDQLGYPYYAIATRISFDTAESYPKFIFNPIRPLTDAEADIILEMQKSPEVARILAEDVGGAPAAAPAQPAYAFEQPVAVATPAPAPVATPAPAPVAAQPAPAPVQPAPVQPAAQTAAQTMTLGGFGAAAPVVAQPAQPAVTATAAPAPSTGATGGFGPMTAPAPVAPAAEPAMPPASMSAAEAELEAKLAALLPA